MKITQVEIVRSRDPLVLPEPWRPAWTEPSGQPVTTFGFSCYRLHTDEGLVGIGPDTGHPHPAMLEGFEPFRVGEFWNRHLSGRRAGNSGQGAAGLEIALWDLIGKAANQPVYKLLGACREKLPVYAATSRLLDKDQHVRQALEIREKGFKAVKLRLHRPNPWDDLAVVEAVREAVGEDLLILVDANQNNTSEGYAYWSRRTALQMARELDDLDVYFLEEPLPRRDVEGLAEIAASVEMFIAGGEHSPTIHDFKEPILSGAYDILQPDALMTGNFGITGLRELATVADYFGRLIVPHVLSNALFPLAMAATLHAMATVENCPLVEYPYDPPILTPETMQAMVKEPLLIDEEGYVQVPDGPGLGIEIDEDKVVVN